MLQRELADRVLAAPGSDGLRHAQRLRAALVHAASACSSCRARSSRRGRRCARPSWRSRRARHRSRVADVAVLRALVRAAFGQRRKQLRGALEREFPRAAEALARVAHRPARGAARRSTRPSSRRSRTPWRLPVDAAEKARLFSSGSESASIEPGSSDPRLSWTGSEGNETEGAMFDAGGPPSRPQSAREQFGSTGSLDSCGPPEANMSEASRPEARVTVPALARKKLRGEKIAMLTAYDFPFARIFDQAGIDVLLVGDTHGPRGAGPRHDAARHARRDDLPLPAWSAARCAARWSSATCRSAAIRSSVEDARRAPAGS